MGFKFCELLLCDVPVLGIGIGCSWDLSMHVFLSREYPFQITFLEFICSNCVFVLLLLQVNCGLSKRKKEGSFSRLGNFGRQGKKVYNRAYSLFVSWWRLQLALASPSDNLHACAVSARITVISK
jgi:hypothetical protein